MGGELSIKIDKVMTSNVLKPEEGIDLSLRYGNEFLHICGENDWGYFALDILKPIFIEAENIIKKVESQIDKDEDTKIDAIILGLAQQRIMDIYLGGKGKCTDIIGIPVARSKDKTAFKIIKSGIQEEVCNNSEYTIDDVDLSECPF